MAGNATARYPQELKDRAVRMVAEIEVRSWNGVRCKKSRGFEVSLPLEAVRKWVRRAEVGSGSGDKIDKSAELKRLKRENASVEAG